MLYKAINQIINKLILLIIKCVLLSNKFSISSLISTLALINPEITEFKETFIHRLIIIRT
jgi:hypothetical protein